jgi:hypothetical protein
MTTLFVVVTLLLQIFVPYHNYVRYLKWLTLSLLAYAAVMFTIQVRWSGFSGQPPSLTSEAGHRP